MASPSSVPARRPYNSPIRRQQAAQTRARILAAGSELVHGYPSWDWRDLTFREVAEKAGVSERTVYRHFATEVDLHRAVMGRLEEEAGVHYEGLTLEELSEVTARVFESFLSFAAWTGEPTADPPFEEVDTRRRSGISAAIAPYTEQWSAEEKVMAAGLLDSLWAVPTFERLTSMWGLGPDRSIASISWAIEVVADAIRRGERPPDPLKRPPGAKSTRRKQTS